jgi:hypothetical protein
VATPYRYCASCLTLWDRDSLTGCPSCAKPGLTDTTQTASCASCDVAWHPGMSVTCWMCGLPGSYLATASEWERLPQAAKITHSALFPAGAPV